MKKHQPLDTAVSFDPYFGEPGRDGDQYYDILPDGKVFFRLKAPGAHEVALDQFGNITPLTRVAENMWEGAVEMGAGFKYFFLKVDGCDVLNPYLPIGYGCCRPMNFVDVPVPGEDWNALRDDVPHGSVARHYYFSTVSGKTESCLVYLPATYDAAKKYPVLYLQHGYGENETGWVYQGRANHILERMIASGEAVPMLVVMCTGMVNIEGTHHFDIFPEVLLRDVIPFIEREYNVKTDKWHRAMAGLSMGSMHTSMTTLTHPELFGYAGLFSGFMHYIWKEEQPHLAALDNPEKFAKDFRVFFRAMGDKDPFFTHFEGDDALVTEKGVDAFITRKLYQGGHGWQIWRESLRDFLPLIFTEG